jgi:PEGA domain
MEGKGKLPDMVIAEIARTSFKTNPARRPQSTEKITDGPEAASEQPQQIQRKRSTRRLLALIGGAVLIGVMIVTVCYVGIFGVLWRLCKVSITGPSLTGAPTAAKSAPLVSPSSPATDSSALIKQRLQSSGGGLWFSTDPPGATVIIDGSIVMTTPATISDLSPGRHHLQIVLDGYYSEQQDIEVKARQVSVTGRIVLRARTDQFDGKWIGHSSAGSNWTGILTIEGGSIARVTMEASERLPPKATHWNNIPAPYDKSRTISFQWTTESNSVRVTPTTIAFSFNEWTSILEPSGIPRSAAIKNIHQPPAGKFNAISPPNRDWAFTLKGSELVSGEWTFRRKR